MLYRKTLSTLATDSSIFRGTDASIKKSGLDGLFFIASLTALAEIRDLPLAVEVRITSKWCTDS